MILEYNENEINEDAYGLIYRYTYVPDGRMYYGQVRKRRTKRKSYTLLQSFQERQKEHLFWKNHNEYFHRALRKYTNDFKLEIVETSFSKEELNKKEIDWIKKDKTFFLMGKSGFNLTKGGEGSVSGTYEERYGTERAKEIIEKKSGENHPHFGKTWEEIFGKEKAKKLKEQQSKRSKGKSLEDLYGKEKADQFIKIMKGTWEERFGKERAKQMKKQRSVETSGKNSSTWGKTIFNYNEVSNIIDGFFSGISKHKLAKKYKVSRATIRNVLNGRGSYSEILENILNQIIFLYIIKSCGVQMFL